MISMKTYLFLFLCSNLPFKVKTEFEINHENVKIQNSDNIFIKSVTIHKSEQRNIYMYNRQITNMKAQECTEYAFYTAVSCKFADWAINNIYDFIKLSPLLYRNKFENYHRIYQNVFHPFFKESMAIFITTINEYIDRLINILNNFLDVYSHSSYYNDTTILKELISLKMKIDFLSVKKTERSFKRGKLDGFIIRIILEEMNVFQRFLALNCQDIKPNKKNSTFYGYWMTIEDVLTEVSTINNFLYNMRYSNLELDQRKCSFTQTFLENIIQINSNDSISLDIANTKIKTTGTETMTIADIFEQIQVTYDVDLIFWYQDSILTSIIKLVYSKIIKIIQVNPLSEEIKNKIMEIDSKIYENETKLPIRFVNGFTFLAEVIKTNKDLIKQLEEYETSLNSIELEEQDPTLERIESIVLGKSQHGESVDKIQIKNCIFVDVDLVLDDFTYLNVLITKILSNFDDLKCFHHYFKCFQKEQEKYFIPSIKNKTSLLSAEDYSYDYVQTCEFILNIYSICHRGVIFINESIGLDPDIPNEPNFMRAWTIISDIKDYFLKIIKINTNNLGFLKMSFNIAIILINLQDSSQYQNKKYHLERIFNVIMTELNSYGIKHCTSSKFNYLLFSDINFVHFGKSEKINYFMDTFLKQINTKNIDTKIKLDDYQHLSVQCLYRRFISNSVVFRSYGDYIKVYWKGKKQTIKTIYENLTFLTLNSLDLYALYDIYFKFFIAALYYEMRDVFKKSQIRLIKLGFSHILKHINRFKVEYFPRELHYFILDIFDLLKTPQKISDQQECEKKIFEHKKKIDLQFAEFNFSFEKYKCPIIESALENLVVKCFTDNALIKINTELYSNVKPIKDFFSKLKH